MFPCLEDLGLYDAVTFNIEGTEYIGLGWNNIVGNNLHFSKYSPNSHEWEILESEFPGKPRFGAVAFVIGEKAYVGLGYMLNHEEAAVPTDAGYPKADPGGGHRLWPAAPDGHGKLSVQNETGCHLSEAGDAVPQQAPCRKPNDLQDRTGAKFPLLPAYGHRTEIQNSAPVWLADKPEWKHCG